MSCRLCGTEDTNLDLCNTCAELEHLREQVTVLKAERDEHKNNLDKLAVAFENAMVMVAKKIQLAYVSGWTAGRVMDERVELGKETSKDAAMFLEALDSFQRWYISEAAKGAVVGG